IDRVDADEQPVSSTRIRGLLEEGDLSGVASVLGRHYAINGIVRYGAQRGRALGFRTANLRVGPLRGCPLDGVYAVWGQVGDVWQAGVANLGRRPSFDLGERLLEVHLMDFEGSLYGTAMRVLFVDRLRSERRFDDPDRLVAQVQEDMVRARVILSANPPRDLTLCTEPAIAS
ncbi:MAG: riboflavin kinase, partial [Anaerolineae bacterium]